MLNLIGVNLKACTLGQNNNFGKVFIHNNGFVYHVAHVMQRRLVLSCGHTIEFCEQNISQLQVFDFIMIFVSLSII